MSTIGRGRCGARPPKLFCGLVSGRVIRGASLAQSHLDDFRVPPLLTSHLSVHPVQRLPPLLALYLPRLRRPLARRQEGTHVLPNRDGLYFPVLRQPARRRRRHLSPVEGSRTSYQASIGSPTYALPASPSLPVFAAGASLLFLGLLVIDLSVLLDAVPTPGRVGYPRSRF